MAQLHAEAAYQLAPNVPEVQHALADLRRLEGNRGAAVLDLLSRAKKSAGDDPEVLYVEGAYWANEGQQARAVDLLEQAVARVEPEEFFARAAFRLAMVHYAQGRFAEAKQQAQRILEKSGDHEWAMRLLEVIEEDLTASREEERVAAAAEATPKLAPSKEPEPKKEADVVSEEEEAQEADASAASTGESEEASRKGKDSYSAMVKRAQRLARQERILDALRLFEQALRKKPKGLEATLGLAYCYLDLERYGDAMSGFRRALNVNPESEDGLIGMAESYRMMGNRARARDYYQAYLQLYPGGSQAALANRYATEIGRDMAGTAAPASEPTNRPRLKARTPVMKAQ